MTPERQVFNEEVLPKFALEYVKDNDVIVDIGKPNDGWGYNKLFNKAKYLTLDRNPELKPDIVMDLEWIEEYKQYIHYANCIIAHGVWEQCNNPFELYDGIVTLLKPKGYGLLGIMLSGFPLVQDLDLFRFTEQGVHRLLKDDKIEYTKICYRDSVPSYAYVIIKNEPSFLE